MKKFEYYHMTVALKYKMSKGYYLEDEAFIEEMNILGNQGWELVCNIEPSIGGSSQTVILLFKRPLEA